jgi:hypothetical protein
MRGWRIKGVEVRVRRGKAGLPGGLDGREVDADDLESEPGTWTAGKRGLPLPLGERRL